MNLIFFPTPHHQRVDSPHRHSPSVSSYVSIREVFAYGNKKGRSGGATVTTHGDNNKKHFKGSAHTYARTHSHRRHTTRCPHTHTPSSHRDTQREMVSCGWLAGWCPSGSIARTLSRTRYRFSNLFHFLQVGASCTAATA